MGIEYEEETIARLREQLGREPTGAEVRVARDALIRKAYAAMLATDGMFRDEASMPETPPTSTKDSRS